MDDEQERDARMTALFHDAASDSAPPGFDAEQVVATSRRITRRRRSALAGGALAVLAVAGIGVAGLQSRTGSELTVASAGSAPVAAPESAADAAQDGAPEAARAAAPGAAQEPGNAAGGAAVPRAAPVEPAPAPDGRSPAAASAGRAPLGPGTGECADRQDPALRALVEQALPEVVGAPEAVTTQECRPGGQRGVALEVRDGATAGVLSVTYLPPGTAADSVGAPDGALAVPTASGGIVVVSCRADRYGEPRPFADRLGTVAAQLAPQL